MSLSLEQLELIKLIDNKVKAIILNGGSEEEILISLLDKMPKIKTIINSFANLKIAEENEYYDRYTGFYQYVKILENLATGISKGKIKVPEYV